MKLKELWRRSKNEDLELLEEAGLSRSDEKALRVVGLLKTRVATQGWNSPPPHYEEHLLAALSQKLGQQKVVGSQDNWSLSVLIRSLTQPKMAWALSFVVIVALTLSWRSKFYADKVTLSDQMFLTLAKRQGAEESHRWLASLGDPLIRAQSISSATDILAEQLEGQGTGTLEKVFGKKASKL